MPLASPPSLFDRFSMTQARRVFRLGVLLLLVIALPAAAGWLQFLERPFSGVMDRIPLSGAFVLAVALVGPGLLLSVRIVAAAIRARSARCTGTGR